MRFYRSRRFNRVDFIVSPPLRGSAKTASLVQIVQDCHDPAAAKVAQRDLEDQDVIGSYSGVRASWLQSEDRDYRKASIAVLRVSRRRGEVVKLG
jgi:hypothetical protein